MFQCRKLDGQLTGNQRQLFILNIVTVDDSLNLPSYALKRFKPQNE
ncbi:TPA: hypothetical protein JF895_000576 [Legionella pneumophila]|nr:hypothetical protein [Legionella pneumophila]MCZ4698761.1 hypothetical protein [Legionella pneumophila]HAT1949251.1 hypothetical protein [Legionella pneumophila]HAT6324008.1 hypothetical protein [Legionella pneumophila]HAT6372712.1 hypothetical protein [Legionella pneumophila]HAT6819065.1 hypothetical protein [Legionella pneumophila]